MTVYLFPGQGSQFVGMGLSLYEEYNIAQETFLCANDILGYDIRKVCFEGPKEKLNETEYAQLGIFVTSIACLRVVEEREVFPPPMAVAGHSLGEYTALVASRSIDFQDALLLVKERARLMKEVSSRIGGGMAAILGLKEDKVRTICDEVGLEIANFNSPDQIVITGIEDRLLHGMELAKIRGAKRVVRLSVSGPFHSRYLVEAGRRLREILDRIEIIHPSIPLVANVSAEYIKEPDKIRESLSRQIFSPVRWEEGMRRLIRDGFKDFIEIGPGRVLSGLLRKIESNVNIRNLEWCLKEG